MQISIYLDSGAVSNRNFNAYKTLKEQFHKKVFQTNRQNHLLSVEQFMSKRKHSHTRQKCSTFQIYISRYIKHKYNFDGRHNPNSTDLFNQLVYSCAQRDIEFNIKHTVPKVRLVWYIQPKLKILLLSLVVENRFSILIYFPSHNIYKYIVFKFRELTNQVLTHM